MQIGTSRKAGGLQVGISRVAVVGLPVIVAMAAILSVTTANECHSTFEIHHQAVSYVPSLLYGIVTWFWWIAVVCGLWTYGQRNAAFLRFSAKGIFLHSALAGVLSVSHIVLLQWLVRGVGLHWTLWGSAYNTWRVGTGQRYGVEVMVYGFIYAFAGLLASQSQNQRTLVQKLQVERQLTEAQLKALQMQMEPHFLFNTLNAITSLVTQGRNQEANKTLSHLNAILRTTLRRRAPEKVPFTEELRVVESYLAIQRVRFADRLEIRIDASREAMDCLVPSFLLQPLVENAVQHGIAPSEVGGLIEARAKRVGDALWLQVRDTGLGAEAPASTGHGIGIENTKERLAYFYPGTHVFNAGPMTTGGYEVNIQIPYEKAVTV